MRRGLTDDVWNERNDERLQVLITDITRRDEEQLWRTLADEVRVDEVGIFGDDDALLPIGYVIICSSVVRFASGKSSV